MEITLYTWQISYTDGLEKIKKRLSFH